MSGEWLQVRSFGQTEATPPAPRDPLRPTLQSNNNWLMVRDLIDGNNNDAGVGYRRECGFDPATIVVVRPVGSGPVDQFQRAAIAKSSEEQTQAAAVAARKTYESALTILSRRVLRKCVAEVLSEECVARESADARVKGDDVSGRGGALAYPLCAPVVAMLMEDNRALEAIGGASDFVGAMTRSLFAEHILGLEGPSESAGTDEETNSGARALLKQASLRAGVRQRAAKVVVEGIVDSIAAAICTGVTQPTRRSQRHKARREREVGAVPEVVVPTAKAQPTTAKVVAKNDDNEVDRGGDDLITSVAALSGGELKITIQLQREQTSFVNSQKDSNNITTATTTTTTAAIRWRKPLGGSN
eukprot:PhM_4_TR9746/c4_g5_i1/m.99864